MTRRTDRRWIGGILAACALAALVGGAGWLGHAANTRRAEARLALGRALFEQGLSGEGAITGYIGADRIPLEGDLVACARCHGERGGGARGGEAAPPIRATALFSAVPEGSSERLGRPAYDDATFARALTEGRSSSGRALSWVMPRFALGAEQVEALAAYLRHLDTQPVPGVHADRLVLGVRLPRARALAAVGDEVRAVLTAAFAEVNAAGGVYGRRVELRVADDGEPSGVLSTEVLALVAPLSSGPRDTEALASEHRVPVVAPVGLAATDPTLPVFAVHPGPHEQGRWAVQQLGDRRGIALLYSDDERGRAWADGVREQRARQGDPTPPALELPLEGVDERRVRAFLEAAGELDVLVSVPPRSLATLVEFAPPGVRFFGPSSLARPELAFTAAQAERVRFVYPAEGGLGDGGVPIGLTRFLSRHGLRPGHVAFQANALAGARIAIEALRRAGRDLDRAAFVAALESLQDFDTGVTPPITFGPGVRTGVRGARWVRVDPRARRVLPASDWVAQSP